MTYKWLTNDLQMTYEWLRKWRLTTDLQKKTKGRTKNVQRRPVNEVENIGIWLDTCGWSHATHLSRPTSSVQLQNRLSYNIFKYCYKLASSSVWCARCRLDIFNLLCPLLWRLCLYHYSLWTSSSNHRSWEKVRRTVSCNYMLVACQDIQPFP